MKMVPEPDTYGRCGRAAGSRQTIHPSRQSRRRDARATRRFACSMPDELEC
jgi:hypothetical protein